MSGSGFVVREGHFHITDKNRYVVTGWFDDGAEQIFTARLGTEPLNVFVRCFQDSLVRQKYAKYDKNIDKEYVIIVELPEKLDGHRWLTLCLADGRKVFRRRESQLRKIQGRLNFRITNSQITGASCILNGWAASEKPIKINVFDQTNEPVKCEISHFPKPDVELEYREVSQLSESGFSVTVPMSGRKKFTLQITDGEMSARFKFSAVDKHRIMLYLKKAHYFLRRNGLKNACKRAVNEIYELIGDTGNYMKWREKNAPTQAQLTRQRQDTSLESAFYIVTPYQDSRHFTQAALSINNQTYAKWKWVVVCMEKEKSRLKERLDFSIPKDQLILVQADESSGYQNQVVSGIQAAMADIQPVMEGVRAAERNMKSAAEDIKNHDAVYEKSWILLLDASDMLEPDALYNCAAAIQKNVAARMCYTDEDVVSEDGTIYKEPAFKPDFNLDMLRAWNYLGAMVSFRADIVKKISAWNPVFGTDAVYDYYLRATEACIETGVSAFESIIHVPHVSYHVREGNRRAHFDSGSGINAEKILNEHFKRQNIPAKAIQSQVPGILRTVYQWNETPMVSINIPNKDHIDDLDTCVQSVLKNCKYPNYEIVIIENNSVLTDTFDYYKKIQRQDDRVRVIYWKDTYNFAKITNFGAEHSSGEYLLLLNNDTEVISPDFMEEMLGFCMRKDVGVCGARLLYFDDTVQHAGVIIGLGGICGEGFQKFPKESGGYQNRILCPQDMSAVTGACLMTKKSVFMEVGGMDGELQIAYNDIDYCLKVRQTGRLVVYNPFALLHHYEYKSRGAEDTAKKLARYNHEVDIFTTRWAAMISEGDPYYNPNLTRRYQDFSLRRIEFWK